MQAADDLAVRALEHLDDLAFRPSAPVGAGDADGHAVAVQRLAHLARGERDVGVAGVADQEAVAVRVAFEPPGDEVELRGDQEPALAVDEDLAAVVQSGDDLVERGAGRALQVQPLGQLVRRERNAGVGERREDGGARRGGGGGMLL